MHCILSGKTFWYKFWWWSEVSLSCHQSMFSKIGFLKVINNYINFQFLSIRRSADALPVSCLIITLDLCSNNSNSNFRISFDFFYMLKILTLLRITLHLSEVGCLGTNYIRYIMFLKIGFCYYYFWWNYTWAWVLHCVMCVNNATSSRIEHFSSGSLLAIPVLFFCWTKTSHSFWSGCCKASKSMKTTWPLSHPRGLKHLWKK